MDDLENIVNAAEGEASRWASVAVVPQARENADTEVQARAKWSRIYKLFGASGESEQDEVFAAVNLYFLTNGCSPYGKYSKQIQTAGGRVADSGDIVKVTGKLEGDIRQFMRGRLKDSYMFLKNSPTIKNDDDLAQVAENAGVHRDQSWLLADWLGRDCKLFKGDESSVYATLRSSKIAAAREKALAALPASDPVLDRAPETKMIRPTQQSVDNGALF